MFLKAFLPFFLMVVTHSSSSLGLLFPPEENTDYPLYDFPSVQYLPHNTLVEYQDPRHNHPPEEEEEEDEEEEEEKMEVATRSTYFPISSSDLAASSSSSSSSASSPSQPYPYPPPQSSSSSSSSSSGTLPCTSEDIAKMLNTEDLDKMMKIVAKIEGKTVKEILLKLASKHGLHLKGGRRGSPMAHPPPPPPDPLRSLQILDPSPPSQRPLVHLRRPPKGIPPRTEGRARPIVKDGELFEPVAIEVPAISPRGLSSPMRLQALVVVEDAGREEVARMAVDLGPRMALLDVLKEARLVYALDNGPYRHNPFEFKARKLESERCLGLQAMGRVGASPNAALQISVTRTRPIAEVIWESYCLPRVSELLVRTDDVIVLSPR